MNIQMRCLRQVKILSLFISCRFASYGLGNFMILLKNDEFPIFPKSISCIVVYYIMIAT